MFLAVVAICCWIVTFSAIRRKFTPFIPIGILFSVISTVGWFFYSYL